MFQNSSSINNRNRKKKIGGLIIHFVTLLLLSFNLNAQELDLENLDNDRKNPIKLTYKIINGDTLNLILRYPIKFNKSQTYPSIIFFFGGGWNGGKVSQFKPQAEYFGSRGMITVLADYRVKKRQGTTPYEAVNDAKSAIRFLRKYSEELNVDQNRIVASGGSAGGHLAAACGNLRGLDEAGEDLSISSKANALVLFNPVFDNGPEGFQHKRMGERWKEISPAHNITVGAPPTVVFLGKEDHLIPVSVAENYKTKMEAIGSRCDLHIYDKAKHGFFNNYKYDGKFYTKTLYEADLFLISLGYLKGKPLLIQSSISNSLDIEDYLNASDGESIYPSNEQIEMLKKVIPNKSFQPAPPISERIYWNKIAESYSGREYYQKALAEIDKEPEVPISDETYRRANKEGNRRIYKSRYYRTMDRLEKFILAECMENKGRFITQITNYSNAIMKMKSWLHPNHDDSENSVLEGKRVAIDLGARKFGLVLALADAQLQDKLSPDLRSNISEQLRWRIIESYLNSCATIDTIDNRWIKTKSNWNSVCNSGTIFTTIVASKNHDERIAAIGCALNSSVYYLSGFGEDGYCSEGVGYWNYGFGHYLYLAEILHDYTDGKLDLFKFNNPEKLKRIAEYPEKYQLNKDLYAPFSDGIVRVRNGADNFAYVMAAKHYGVNKPTFVRVDEAVQEIILWSDSISYIEANPKQNTLSSVTYFDDHGIVISRGIQKSPFSVSIKAGHNAENHNHDDVGSYVIALGDEIFAGDLGGPVYIEGAFAKDNPARCSWGHSVPIIENKLQTHGAEYYGKVIKTEFSEQLDKAILDILPAYEIEGLKKLNRHMKNDKKGSGTITIIDEFSAEKPIQFETAITTFSDYEIIDDQNLFLTNVHNKDKIKVEVESVGGDIKIVQESIPVRMSRGKNPTRIGIEFIEKVKAGSITIKYQPISNN